MQAVVWVWDSPGLHLKPNPIVFSSRPPLQSSVASQKLRRSMQRFAGSLKLSENTNETSFLTSSDGREHANSFEVNQLEEIEAWKITRVFLVNHFAARKRCNSKMGQKLILWLTIHLGDFRLFILFSCLSSFIGRRIFSAIFHKANAKKQKRHKKLRAK